MDAVSELFLGLHFRIAFLERKGTAFQDWFVTLARHALGPDFEPIRPYGRQGDWKCDGRQLSTGTIFQCYAPDTEADKQTIRKINDDFPGALAKWPNFIQAWIFVHNDPRGVPPTIANHLDQMRRSYPRINFQIWSQPELFVLFNKMDSNAKRLMFGAVPDRSLVDGLALEDLKPVVDALERRDPDPKFGLPPPPSVQKLEKNDLSAEAADILRMGRHKVRLVETYFQKTGPVEHGEKIAEAFRKQYAYLKSLELTADQVFMHLQKYAGVQGEPRRQAAAMAVLAYLFDSCDIFEDPEIEAPGT